MGVIATASNGHTTTTFGRPRCPTLAHAGTRGEADRYETRMSTSHFEPKPPPKWQGDVRNSCSRGQLNDSGRSSRAWPADTAFCPACSCRPHQAMWAHIAPKHVLGNCQVNPKAATGTANGGANRASRTTKVEANTIIVAPRAKHGQHKHNSEGFPQVGRERHPRERPGDLARRNSCSEQSCVMCIWNYVLGILCGLTTAKGEFTVFALRLPRGRYVRWSE
jgi:hypothetical protein